MTALIPTTFVVPLNNIGQRIDNFLFTQFKGLPKSRLYRAVRSGEVRVNQKRVKASYRLQSQDTLRLPPLRIASPTTKPLPPLPFLKQLENAILLEDKSLIIINKPTGVASHGGSGIHYGVIEGFRALRPNLKFLALAHRLDRETTGCLILAKKPSVLKELHRLLLDKLIKKTYLLLVAGLWNKGQYTVDAPLMKNQLLSGERFVTVHPEGKPACTLFKSLQIFSNVSLLQATPATGRTHQIRVHAAYLGYPILGDSKYMNLGNPHKTVAKDKISSTHTQAALKTSIVVRHLLLHAASLEFNLLGENYAVSACFDPEFKNVLSQLRLR